VSLRVSPEVLLIGSFVLAGIGWLVFWAAHDPALAVVGLVVAGLGYGAQYPIGIVLTMRASGGRPDGAAARAALAAGAAIGVAPFLLGALADAVGPHSAFVLVPILIATGATSVALGRRSSRQADAHR
jgi:cyanate permease